MKEMRHRGAWEYATNLTETNQVNPKNLNFEFQSSLEIKVERKTQFSLAYTQTLRTRATTGMILESMGWID